MMNLADDIMAVLEKHGVLSPCSEGDALREHLKSRILPDEDLETAALNYIKILEAQLQNRDTRIGEHLDLIQELRQTIAGLLINRDTLQTDRDWKQRFMTYLQRDTAGVTIDNTWSMTEVRLEYQDSRIKNLEAQLQNREASKKSILSACDDNHTLVRRTVEAITEEPCGEPPVKTLCELATQLATRLKNLEKGVRGLL